MTRGEIDIVLENYSHFISYDDEPVSKFGKYTDYDISEEADTVKFYTGNILAPECALYAPLSELSCMCAEPVTDNTDEITLKMEGGRSIMILAYRNIL